MGAQAPASTSGEGAILYDHAVYMARLAQRTSTIAAVLWQKDEGDFLADYGEPGPNCQKNFRAINAALEKIGAQPRV